jgi:hypothetical protein
VTTLHLDASSQAEEAGFLAMRDLAAVTADLGIKYRIVGGQMVRLHVALAGVAEPVVRVTQDADMGIAEASARNPGLVPGLEALGYARPDAANRFVRTTDEIPGLSLALARPGEQIDLTVTLLDGTTVHSRRSSRRSTLPFV